MSGSGFESLAFRLEEEREIGRVGDREALIHLPLFLIRPDGEKEIMPRFERGVPGSNPGRGTDNYMVSVV